MTTSTSASPIALPVPKLSGPALLFVDRSGLILNATAHAESLWRAAPGGLLERNLGTLLCLEGRDRFDVEEWSHLFGAALNQNAACTARAAAEGGTTGSVIARIEGTHGDERFFVTLTQPESASRSTPVLVDSALALMADQGAVGFFDLNFRAEQVYYSPAWKRMLGYFETELANTYDSWLRLLHPDDSAAAPDHVSRKQARGIRSFSVEVRMLHRRGHYVWVHCLGTQMFGPHGDLERVTGLQIDITERKELEEHSLLNEERVQRLANEGNLALFDFNFSTQEFWISESWKELIGASGARGAEALQTFVDALPPELSVQGAQSFFVEPNIGQPTFLKPLQLRHTDGSAVQVMFGAHRQLSRRGDLMRAVGFSCAMPAITIATREEGPIPSALLDTVLGAFGEGLLLTDSRGQVVYANERALRYTGYAAGEIQGHDLESVFRLQHASTGTIAPEALESALASGDDERLYGDYLLINRLDETSRKIVWSARRLTSEEGNARAVLVVFRDPDEMSLTPEELLRINRFETLGVVAGGISHDFNNLLTTILGGISQAKDNKDYNYLADSERACMAAKALTKQLLAIAKGGKAEVVQTIAIADVLRDAVRLARAGTSALIRIEVPDTIHPVSVDRSQILQVFQNLVINALQALPARGGTLALSGLNCELDHDQVASLPAGNYVRIEVRDNGCGIAPENLEKIFEPFFTTKKHGTGLGLSMVRSLARKYGGDVLVESVVGKGTTFVVYLPEANAPIDVQKSRQTPSLRFGTGRVLLMDDDPDICRLAEGMLASLDYKYDIVRKGEEAVALYRRYLNVGRPYDAVILDLTVVGGAGGEETFHQLREMDPQVRAIVCSGYDSEDMIHHYTTMGFSGYLTKPFRVGDLGKALKSAVG